MTRPSDILDYASPRAQGQYRLPSLSRLDVKRDGDGLTIVETLTGRTSAIIAMSIGLLSVIVLPFSGLSQVGSLARLWSELQSPESRVNSVFGVAFFMTLWCSDVIVLLLVANNTWRETVLDARDGTVSLSFRSLFGRNIHRWPLEQVLDVLVDRTLELEFADPKIELLLRVHGGQLIRLFADHKEAELEPIAANLRQMLPWPAAVLGNGA